MANVQIPEVHESDLEVPEEAPPPSRALFDVLSLSEPLNIDTALLGPLEAFMASIEVGTQLVLDGPVWKQEPGSGWTSETVRDLTVLVARRTDPAEGDVMLLCHVQGSEVVWAVQEAFVLRGGARILNVSPPVVEEQPPVVEESPQVVEESPQVPEEQTPPEPTPLADSAPVKKRRTRKPAKVSQEEFLTLAQEYLDKKMVLDQAMNDFETFISKNLKTFSSMVDEFGSDGLLQIKNMVVQISQDSESEEPADLLSIRTV